MILVLSGLMFTVAQAQTTSGGTFTIEQGGITSGGGTSSEDCNEFSTTGAIGQPLTGTSSNTPYTMKSGTFTAAPLAPTAASVTVSGRVLTFNGRGISRTLISVTDSSGTIRTTLTNPFGHFQFTDIAVGETYIFSIRSKQFQFAEPTQILFVSEDFSGLNFTALP